MLIGPFSQTLEFKDLGGVIALVILEALLSADNALVLAIMVKHLSKAEQKKALLYGLGGAFFFRLLAILFATIILKQWWLQAIGAMYLLFVTRKHFVSQTKDEEEINLKPRSFWWTVVAVELTDIAFAVDSVLAGITFIGNKMEKVWVVFFGAIIGIVLLRFAASFFIKLLAKYPTLDHVAYAIVGWVGVKLSFISAHSWSIQHPGSPQVPELPTPVFWIVLVSIATIGSFLASKVGVTTEEISPELTEILEDASDLQFENEVSPEDTHSVN